MDKIVTWTFVIDGKPEHVKVNETFIPSGPALPPEKPGEYREFYDAVYKAQDPALPDMPDTFIQWKGTSVCMDIHCPCGAHSHLDEEFAYHFKCAKCGAVYAVGQRVRMIRLTEEQAKYVEQRSPNCIKTDVDFSEDGD